MSESKEMLLTLRALDERDLLRKRIIDAIDKSTFITAKKSNETKTKSGHSSTEFSAEAKSSMSRIKDLISRYERLDEAILLANATEKVEVAGKEMTRATAINLRKSLLGTGSTSNTDFRGMLIRKLNNEKMSAELAVKTWDDTAASTRDTMLSNLSSSDKKEITSDALNSIDSYCKGLSGSIYDPSDAIKTLDTLEAEREELISNLESAIKISNATTYIEF